MDKNLKNLMSNATDGLTDVDGFNTVTHINQNTLTVLVTH